jgi:hypothetical protein
MLEDVCCRDYQNSIPREWRWREPEMTPRAGVGQCCDASPRFTRCQPMQHLCPWTSLWLVGGHLETEGPVPASQGISVPAGGTHSAQVYSYPLRALLELLHEQELGDHCKMAPWCELKVTGYSPPMRTAGAQNPRILGFALIRKGFWEKVTMGSQARWLPPQGARGEAIAPLSAWLWVVQDTKAARSFNVCTNWRGFFFFFN